MAMITKEAVDVFEQSNPKSKFYKQRLHAFMFKRVPVLIDCEPDDDGELYADEFTCWYHWDDRVS